MSTKKFTFAIQNLILFSEFDRTFLIMARKSAKKKEIEFDDETFLEEVCKDGNITRACKMLKISRKRLFRRRATCAEFYDKVEKARQIGIDAFIDECHRRAFYGVDEPVFHMGEIVGYKKRYSDTLAMFLIKAWRPEYRDNFNLIGLSDDSKFCLTINTGDVTDTITVTPTPPELPPHEPVGAPVKAPTGSSPPKKKRPRPYHKRKAPPLKGRKRSDVKSLLKSDK